MSQRRVEWDHVSADIIALIWGPITCQMDLITNAFSPLKDEWTCLMWGPSYHHHRHHRSWLSFIKSFTFSWTLISCLSELSVGFSYFTSVLFGSTSCKHVNKIYRRLFNLTYLNGRDCFILSKMIIICCTKSCDKWSFKCRCTFRETLSVSEQLQNIFYGRVFETVFTAAVIHEFV